MISLPAKIRENVGRSVKKLRDQGTIPAVLYGPKIKNLNLEIDLKQFESIYKEAGESTLVSLEVADAEKRSEKKFLVLVHDVENDSLSQKPIHIDFYQPKLDEEITVTVPLIFEGEAKAVKDLGGTLVRNIQEIEVRALPQNLPHEIKVSVEKLISFEENVLVGDLALPKGVKVLKDPSEIVALVLPPEKVEEELAKPVEEKVEEVEKIEKKKEVQPEESEEK